MLFEEECSAWHKCSTGIIIRIESLGLLGRGFLDDDCNRFAVHDDEPVDVVNALRRHTPSTC